MRTEAEVRAKVAEVSGKIERTALYKTPRLLTLIAYRGALRWVLGELGEIPVRTGTSRGRVT